jgi:26S proteasome regulatory subunit N3
MATHEEKFRADDTFTLISRLRQNVIKTGLRTMSLTYSRISLHDVCLKLGLDSEETTEYIVAKAIRDGVIEATINHKGGYMQNKEVLDVYATEEPLVAFDERIRFCLSLRDEAVKVIFCPCCETGGLICRL